MKRARRWILPSLSHDGTLVKFSEDVCSLASIARLLQRKGLLNDQQATDFLRPRLRQLSDPFLLPNMRAAVDRILRAISEQERIVLYGDYDVDGVTSLALLNEMLVAYGATPSLFFAFPDGGRLRSERGRNRTLLAGPQTRSCSSRLIAEPAHARK
jgi:single-stranded-DNA-specific exonuclease